MFHINQRKRTAKTLFLLSGACLCFAVLLGGRLVNGFNPRTSINNAQTVANNFVPVTNNAQSTSVTTSATSGPSNSQLTQATTSAQNELKELQQVIQLLHTNNEDSTSYQQALNADQNAFAAAKTVSSMQSLASQITSQLTSDQLPQAQTIGTYLVSQFHQNVTTWGNSHQFHDPYDGKSYPLDFEYDVTPQYYTQYHYGEGAQLDALLAAATTLSDYQNVIAQSNADQTLLQAMENDATSTTAWDQAHATDQQVMQYYHISSGQVLVVSFYEQVVRLYQDGKLLKAYHISTGQYYRPTILGYYQIASHQATTYFTSFEDTSSPLYFPSTTIQNAMGFGDPSAGYFFHASPWRTVYGMNTEFPHNDPDNENSESRNGSHGCVNLAPNDAQWLFDNVQDGASVVLY